MSVDAIPLQPRAIALRPLALPAEHGGWGFLIEPVVLALLVAPSWSGALIAAAALFGFLTRHPLKLALQDAMRGKHYPRTPYCWGLATGYLVIGALLLSTAVIIRGPAILIPLVLAAPLGVVQVVYDARNRSRELLPELSGAAAMSSIAAAIAVAGSFELVPAFVLAGIVLARSLPSIVYVRALLHRERIWPVIAAHVIALAFVAIYASAPAIIAMTILLARAIWGLTHVAPRAQTVGWREIAFGATTVTLVAIGYAL